MARNIPVFSEAQLVRAMRSDAGLNQEFNKHGQIAVLREVVAEPARVEDQKEWKDLMRDLRTFVAIGLKSPVKVSK